MGIQTFVLKAPRTTVNGRPVPEGSDIPKMRPRTGKRGTDAELSALLTEALDHLSRSTCSFFACEGPSRPQAMCTCVKCYAMRRVATVRASLDARAALTPKGGEHGK